MDITLHRNATTVPRVRALIQASAEPGTALARRLGVGEQTRARWRHRDSAQDRLHTAYRLQTTLTPGQETRDLPAPDLGAGAGSSGWYRNGNGTIDSGRELFGDSTLLAGGATAADGFAALVEQDTNADGRVDALDARFADLRIWRDLNQNGFSEAGELSTLAGAGIVAIRTAKTEHSALLANGNQIADLGSYVRTDGTEGDLVEVTGDLADIDLADNPFYSEFTDPVTLTTEAQALPNLAGAGAVRDLQEAANDGVFARRGVEC